MQLLDPGVPVTGLLGFVYSPVTDTDPFFQLPLAFQPTQGSQYENPVGTGHMVKFPQTNFTEPQNAHAIQASAGNKVFSAYSDLDVPLSGISTMDPKAKTLNPFGMKPFGFNWQAGLPVLQGEICTPAAPSTGNGHTYQAQNSGTTGANQPVFPLTEGGTVVDNGITWKETTMVIANRLPPPDSPVLGLVVSAGFPSGEDVYVIVTYINPTGESLPSVPVFVTTTVTQGEVSVTLPLLAAIPGWIQSLSPTFKPTAFKIYVASVTHGSAAPAIATYQQLPGTYAFGSITDFSAVPVAGAPPTRCTARVTPGQLPTPTTQPIIDRDPGGGTFAGGRDVYVRMTYTNVNGETPAGPANSVIDTTLNDAIQVTVQVPLGPDNEQLFEIGSVGIYEADVATGTAAPPASEFSLVGYFQPGTTQLISTTATGANPPVTNTTGPAGNITADTATGGANNTQGFRYAACMWINQMSTFSGFTQASVVNTIIDEDGWEIGAFNIPTGMPNVIGRAIAFSIADATQVGPFNWIGLVNLNVPSQNVVYPTQTLIDQVLQSATAILDNLTTQATFNFTDTYLSNQNNVDDRLVVTIPPKGTRVDFLETQSRLVVSGIPGYRSGCWISVAGDFETFYGDTSPVPISSAGDRCFGVTDKYKGIPFAMMESGGFALSPNTGNPSSWVAERRWGGTDPGKALGPCGFRAWDACGKFIIFAHRSGLYKYDQSNPDMMSKEVPKRWSKINWGACETICVTIDEDTHTVRILVPTGASATPNAEYCLSYIEGWKNPIHFSTYSGKEISMDAARRWSFNMSTSAFICARISRTLPPGGNAFLDGPTFETLPDSSFGLTQLLYASSSPDGTVNARTPGVFSDNGGYIDYQYETMSTGMMQAVCKPEGFNLNAAGGGTLLASFIASREQVTDEGGEQKLIQQDEELPCDPIVLSPKQVAGITRKVPPSINEFWRVRFTGNKQPGDFVSLKAMTVYVIPFTVGRDVGDQ